MLEVEIKLALPSLADALRRLDEARATLTQARAFEDNQLFDDAQQSLRRRQQVLRLRSFAGQHRVTYKGPPERQAEHESGLKVREELESDVADRVACTAILSALGYRPVYRYQKWRTSFSLGAAHVVLDETPLGVFFEIEGTPVAIEAAAHALGFQRSDYETRTYLELHRARAGVEDPGDLLFEHLEQSGDGVAQ